LFNFRAQARRKVTQRDPLKPFDKFDFDWPDQAAGDANLCQGALVFSLLVEL